MQINKTDFKVILNHMKSLSQLENNELINQTRYGKTDYNDINQLINIYSSKKISKLMDKINNNFLTFGGKGDDDKDGDDNDVPDEVEDDNNNDNYNDNPNENNNNKPYNEIETKQNLIKIINTLENYIKQLQKENQPRSGKILKAISRKFKKKTI